MRCFLLSLTLALYPAAALAADAREKSDPATIARWIKMLGSSSFSEREKATRALSEIGAPALEALRAAANSPDSETHTRAARLLPRVTKLADSERFLAPTRVHLIYKDTPLPEALSDFGRQSGYGMALDEHASAKLADRRVTFDTGETTFWQAFDQLRRKAQIVEVQHPLQGPAHTFHTRLARPSQRASVLVASAAAEKDAAARTRGKAAGSRRSAATPERPFTYFFFTAGKPADLPTCYFGAVRVEVAGVSREGNKQGSDYNLNLLATAEPRFEWRGPNGVELDHAVDDRGEPLRPLGPQGAFDAFPSAPPMALWSGGAQPVLELRMKGKGSRQIKDLRAVLHATIRARLSQVGRPQFGSDHAVLIRLALHDISLP